MTDDYHRDMLALRALVQTLDAEYSSLNSDQKDSLDKLKALIGEVKSLALDLDSKILATNVLHQGWQESKKINGELSPPMGKRLDGLRAAGVTGDLSPLESLLLLIEDSNASDGSFLQQLRKALGGKGSSHATLVSNLASTAGATGAAAESLCAKLNKDAGGPPGGTILLASALDALIPVAESGGLPVEVRRTLRALRSAIEVAGGGGPGSSYWPSNYVYSSSGSGGSSSSSSGSGGSSSSSSGP